MEISEQWTSADLLGEAAMSYRCPFKVYQAVWNPRINLLALASQKGEICVRRLYWKRCWKRNVYDVKPLLTKRLPAEKEVQFQSMCWSPDGKVLAVAFDDGCVHLLDVEKGLVRFTVKMQPYVVNMRWQQHSSEVIHKLADDRVTGALGELKVEETGSEKSEELNQLKAMKVFCNIIVPESLVGTLLLCIDVSSVVLILAAGVLPISRIEPALEVFNNLNPGFAVTVGDAYLSEEGTELMIVYSCRGQSVESYADTSPVSFTYLITYKIDRSKCLEDGSLWIIAHRWVQMNFVFCYLKETFSRLTLDWEERSEEFFEKFQLFGKRETSTKEQCSLGECLTNLMLNGHADSDLTSFFRNVLKPAEWKKMNDWVEIGFTELLQNIGSDLLPGAQSLQHHVKQLVLEMKCALLQCRSGNSIAKRFLDAELLPYGKSVREPENLPDMQEFANTEKLADMIVYKVNEVHAVAVRNRKDLNHFARWMSQTPTFTAKRKQGEESSVSSNYHLQIILEYIKQTFILPKQKQLLEDSTTTKTKATMGDDKEDVDDVESKTEKKCDYPFDKVKHYLKSSSGISCHLDIDDSGWKYAFANLSEKELASCSLAQVIAQFTPCLDKIQKIVLRSFSALAVMEKCVLIGKDQQDGFRKFAIFATGCLKSKEPAMFESRKGAMDLAVSCISDSGDRHVIYTASGEILYEACYQMAERSISEVKSPHLPKISRLEIMTKAELKVGGSSELELGAVFSKQQTNKVRKLMPSSQRLVQFEWYGDGIFYELVKSNATNMEETHLVKGNLWDRTICVHKDISSCVESYCMLTLSKERKMGVIFTECGSRLKWFQIDKAASMVQMEEKMKSIIVTDEDLFNGAWAKEMS